MVKRFIRTFPYLIMALVVTGINAFLDGLVNIRIMELLDLAINGQMEVLRNKVPQILIMAALLVPMGILVGIVSSYYRRKANTALKKYYMQKVFAKNIAEYYYDHNQNHCDLYSKYKAFVTDDFFVFITNYGKSGFFNRVF